MPGTAAAAAAEPEAAAQPFDFEPYLGTVAAWNDAFSPTGSPSAAPAAASSAARPPAAATADGAILAEVQQQVPAVFFDASFDIGSSAVFRRAVPIHLQDETRVGQQLASYLDMVRRCLALAARWAAGQPGTFWRYACSAVQRSVAARDAGGLRDVP